MTNTRPGASAVVLGAVTNDITLLRLADASGRALRARGAAGPGLGGVQVVKANT